MAETFENNQYLISRKTTFDELLNDEKHTDIVIVTTDGSKFPCHKKILITGCPYFSGLFASDMVESRQNEVNFNLIDISGSTFKQVLEFIYTGKINLNFEDAKAINIYAGLFVMTNLKDITETYLTKLITNETCLDLWRHSETYLSDKLKEACLSMAANSEVFLDNHVENLTIEEITSIVSLKKLNSKILLQYVVKWIKIDFEYRQQHIKDLMKLINFEDIKDREYERQLFSDEVLKENKEFLKLSVQYLEYLLRLPENAVDVPNKTLFVVTNNKILYTKFDTKEFIDTQLRPESENFATTSYNTNGFLTTGGFQNYEDVNLCTQFYPTINVKKEHPGLLEDRTVHRSYTVGGKIYVCGGLCTKTVEIFEENAQRWISGPAMGSDRFGFGGPDDSENSLYAIGGICDDYIHIDRLDTRENCWHTIHSNRSIALEFTKSIYKDDQIYCFQESNGFIFDIRANKILGTIPYKLYSTMDFMFTQNRFDCTIVDNDIWLIGTINVNSAGEIPPNALKLNLQTHAWERKMFKGLDESANLGLVWCRNS